MSLADAYAEFTRATENGPVELARFGRDLALTRDTITYKGETYPLRGVHIDIDTAGNLTRRPTLTRFLLTGPMAFAWQKKLDSREMYLTVEGPTFGFVVNVHPDIAYGARQFVAKANAAARALDGPSAESGYTSASR